MNFASVFIKRPVFSTMIIVALVVMGMFAYPRLGVDLFPNVEFPYAVVTTTLRGASPEEIETSITKPIEEAVNTIAGLENIESTSFEGMSQVVIQFELEKDVEVAAQEVRDRVNRIMRNLPQGTDPPVIEKFDVGAVPVMSISVYGERNLIELTEIAKKKVKENIETVYGVGAVDIIGGREREIHIVLNPLKMAAMNLTIRQVKEAVQQQNIEIPGGRVEDRRQEIVLRTLGRIGSPQDFERIVIAQIDGTPIRVSDIGHVEDTGQDQRSSARLDGKPCVSLSVKKQSGTNTVAIVKKVKERLEQIQPILPSGVTAEIIRDQSGFIEESVATVEEHLVLGALFAALIVLLFMGNLRSTLIAAVSIPTSIIFTFTLIDLAGFTLNNMTLLALTIAVGIVIDDAIVILENIYRHLDELKKPSVQAAEDGTREIGLAVMATTMSLLVIFVPLAYMTGIIGRFLKSYGLTVAFAIATSLLVAFTMIPMLCSRYLRPHSGDHSRFMEIADRVNDWMAKYYLMMLRWALAHRKAMVAMSVGIILSMFPMLMVIGKDFVPSDDQSEYQVAVKAPEGTSLPMMEQILAQMESEVRRLPYIHHVLASIGEEAGSGVNAGSLYIRLVDQGERDLSQQELMSLTRKMFAKYTTLRTSVQNVGGFGHNYEFSYIIKGPDLEKLQEYASTIISDLKQTRGLVDLDTTFSFAKPELRVMIDRNRAQDLDVKVEDIATSLRTMVGGEEDITKYKEGDDLYQVRLRVDKDYRDRPEAVAALMVPAGQGRVARLDSVASLVPGKGPTQIERYNRQRQIKVIGNLEGLALGTALDKAKQAFEKLKTPPEYTTELEGKAKEMGRMLKGFLVVFFLSFIFMYIVLASQFESFVHPVTILVALPLTIPFALLSLLITNENLTIFSIMGVFMLFGIVKKNAILQVDYTNTLRAKGMERYQAILEANKTRLRPILMTTFTLVMGMMPVAFGTGAGSAVRRTMAWVIVGGQMLSLLITLLMTPVTYSLLDDLQEWVLHKKKTLFHWL
ncbi:MAG TPA: efflux RND transporter permease subunit [Elusimicrobiota bacterium]|nr:efflux RND transporter permease subunit [Elusimicrobiota bacterium]